MQLCHLSEWFIVAYALTFWCFLIIQQLINLLLFLFNIFLWMIEMRKGMFTLKDMIQIDINCTRISLNLSCIIIFLETEMFWGFFYFAIWTKTIIHIQKIKFVDYGLNKDHRKVWNKSIKWKCMINDSLNRNIRFLILLKSS
jgi:hypothetical protein